MDSRLGVQEYVPLISVVIAVYNEEKRLDNCISSILQQTHQNFEIVIVNDGSTDNSAEIINKYVEKYKGKVICINKVNGGLASARNCGINIVKGKYITFLDADDYIDKKYLETLIDVAEKNDSDAVCSGQYKVNEDGKIIRSIIYKPYNGKCLTRRLNISGKIYLTTFVKENNITFPEGKTYEDNSFNLQVFFLTNKIFFIDYAGYYQVVHEGSITSKPIQIENLPLDEWNNCINKILNCKREGVDLQLFEFTTVSLFAYLLFIRIRKREYLSNTDRKSNIDNAIMIAESFQKITNEYFPYARKNKYAVFFKFEELSFLQKMAVKVFSWMCYLKKLKEFTKIIYKFAGLK